LIIGGTLSKNKEVVYYSTSGNFDPFPEFNSNIHQAVMPIVSIADGNLIAHGTGFTITSHGLIMTAKHVVEDAWSHRVRKLNEQGQFYDHYELYVLYQTKEPHPDGETQYIGGLIPVKKLWFCPELDIVYCWLWPLKTKEGDPLIFPAFRLSLGVPKIGENVLGVGYYKMEGSEIKPHILEKFIVGLSLNSAHSKGKVIELFLDGRDSGMLKFPCFRTDARFDPGMSGGPVFNEAGFVCGVICSSTTQVEDDPSYISYVSSIWPSMVYKSRLPLKMATPK
jgi:hypothetical protein